MSENKPKKNIEIQFKGGSCMNVLFIFIILIALMIKFTTQIIVFSGLFLVIRNVSKLSTIRSLLLSLGITILIYVLGIL